jgi:hypothetical protein
MLQQFTLITPVWGHGHTKLFIEIGLASLLAENNLPRLAQLTDVQYLIYTTDKDAEVIKDSSCYKKLQSILSVDVLVFEGKFENNHIGMTVCHKAGLKRAIENNGYAVFIPPDCIWNNGAMTAMYDIAAREYKIIHMSGLRVIKEIFCDEIINKYGTSLSLTSQQIAEVGLGCLHPITNCHFFEEKAGDMMPANLFWSVGPNCVLARNFHFHPLLIDATGIEIHFTSTIDDDLALAFNASEKEEYVVTDSEELLAMEISSWTHSVLAAQRKGSIQDIVAWAESGTNSRHRKLIKSTIKIHYGTINKKAWKTTKKRSDNIVEEILHKLDGKIYYSLKMLNPSRLIIEVCTSKKFTPALRYCTDVMRNVVAKCYRLFSSTEGPYPWHWQYAVYSGVCRPLLNELANYQGKILCIENTYSMFGEQVVAAAKNNRNIKVDTYSLDMILNSQQYFLKELSNHYDAVVVRSNEKLLNQDSLFTFSSILKPNGKLIMTVINPTAVLKQRMPENTLLVSEKLCSGLGVKIIANIHNLRQCSESIILLLRFSLVKSLLRLMIFPIFIIVSPIFSLVMCAMNRLSNYIKIGQEKTLLFVKN